MCLGFFCLKAWIILKLDRVGPVDNRPSIYLLHHYVKKKKKYYVTHDK